MKINRRTFYRIIYYGSIVYISISSILCIIWAGNYPMEDCFQYVLNNTNVPVFANKLNDVMAENNNLELVPKDDDFLKGYQYGIYDESMVSFIRCKDTHEIIRVEAIEHYNDIVLRTSTCSRPRMQLHKVFETQVIERLGEYHRDWIHNYSCTVVYFYNHYFPVLLIGYLLSVILFGWSLKQMQKRWKIASLFVLVVVPFMVLLASLVLSRLRCTDISFRGKEVFNAQSRGIFEGNTDIHQLTFLIVHDNSISDYLNSHKEFDVDYKDNLYENSLLMFAIINNSYNSAKELLEHQANPNFISTYNGGTPLLKTLQNLNSTEKPDTTFLSLVLSFGADANLMTYDKKHERKRAPLMEVRSLEQAYLLVEKGGAKVNKDIICGLKQNGYIYKYLDDSVQSQIIHYYESIMPNE